MHYLICKASSRRWESKKNTKKKKRAWYQRGKINERKKKALQFKKKMKKKGETRNSTLHKHKGLCEDEDRVHFHPLASQTLQDHISLQSNTVQENNKKKKKKTI